MLMNNLDPEVAEKPEDLVVYGGSGKARAMPEALHAIVGALLELGPTRRCSCSRGKPVGVFRRTGAPRVLIANSLLVPRWATWEEFRRLEEMGLTMFGQMTAGSWIYIGTQGIVQGTYQTFAAAARHFGRPASRRHDPDGGPRRHGRRAAARRDDGRRGDPLRRGRSAPHRPAARDAVSRRGTDSLDEALARVARRPQRGGRSPSGCSATRPTSCRRSCARGDPPDLVTDQTCCARSARPGTSRPA